MSTPQTIEDLVRQYKNAIKNPPQQILAFKQVLDIKEGKIITLDMALNALLNQGRVREFEKTMVNYSLPMDERVSNQVFSNLTTHYDLERVMGNTFLFDEENKKLIKSFVYADIKGFHPQKIMPLIPEIKAHLTKKVDKENDFPPSKLMMFFIDCISAYKLFEYAQALEKQADYRESAFNTSFDPSIRLEKIQIKTEHLKNMAKDVKRLLYDAINLRYGTKKTYNQKLLKIMMNTPYVRQTAEMFEIEGDPLDFMTRPKIGMGDILTSFQIYTKTQK